jgi:hypothetical protein
MTSRRVGESLKEMTRRYRLIMPSDFVFTLPALAGRPIEVRRRKMTDKGLTLIGGVGLGAALMYMLDLDRRET